jgi:hypothetical protein
MKRKDPAIYDDIQHINEKSKIEKEKLEKKCQAIAQDSKAKAEMKFIKSFDFFFKITKIRNLVILKK